MKKSIKILLATALTLCLGGALLIGIGAMNGGRQGLAEQLSEGSIYRQEKQPLEGNIDHLTANLSFLNLTIEPSHDNRYYIAYNIIRDSETNPFSYSIENNVLHLEEAGTDATFEKRGPLNWLVRVTDGREYFKTDTNNVTVYVPENALKNLDCLMVYGDLVLQKCTPENLQINLTYGDLDMDNCQWRNATIGLGYGDFSSNAITCSGPTRVSAEYGDITVLNAQLPDALGIQLTTDYGDISVAPHFGGQLDEDDLLGTYYKRAGTSEGQALTISAEYGDITLS